MRTYYQTPAVHKAFAALERLSADDTTRHLAEVRERALREEALQLRAARQEGLEQGLERGLEQGRQETRRATVQQLLALNLLSVEQIAQASSLSVEEVKELASATPIT